MKPVAAVIGALFLSPVFAATDYTDTAQVISVTPIYDRVADTRQDCYVEPVAQSQAQPAQDRSVAAPILGGVAGAIIGSQVGSGRGRDAAAAVGAVVGTVAADRVANPNSDGSIAGAAVGGTAGAILGNQVGRGSGRTAATAAGAVAGAVVGDRVASGSGSPAQRTQAQGPQRCRTVDAGYREVVRGYTVVYRYAGRDVTTQLPYNPGNTVRVAVGVIDSGGRPLRGTAADGYDREYPVPVGSRDPRPEPVYQYRY
jgi:uncharacterized protein YcfJ